MSQPILTRSTAQIVEALTEQLRQVESAGRRSHSEPSISSGTRALDRLLPDRGFRRGTLVEWLGCGAGSGAATLALIAGRQAAREGGALVVVDRQGSFYPPAAAALGIELEKLIVVRPQRDPDCAWALDQVLRCEGAAAVIGWTGKWDDRTFRRLQLAAESSGVLGLLLPPQSVRDAPSWADLRLLVHPLPGNYQHSVATALRVEVLRARGGAAGGAVELEIDDQTGEIHESRTRPQKSALHLASRLADAAPRRRSAGA